MGRPAKAFRVARPFVFQEAQAVTKKTRSSRKRRDWRQTLFIVISILIVLSMVLALVLTFAAPAPPG
jgi:nitrate reductase NapE component